MDYLIFGVLIAAVVLAARRSTTSMITAALISSAAYVLFAVLASRLAEYETGLVWRISVAVVIAVGAFVMLPPRPRPTAPDRVAPPAPTVDRGASTVAELVVPRTWGGDPGSDEALTALAEQARASASGVGRAGVEDALGAFYRGWESLIARHPELADAGARERVWDWFGLLARVGRIDDVAGLRKELEAGTWRIEVTPFKPPSHGRIGADRLLDAAVQCIRERAAVGHVELPGFGAFSSRPRGEATTLLFHDDSEAPLQLAETPFVEDLTARLGATPKTATNAANKLFEALSEQVAANQGANSWVAVRGLGMFELRQTRARTRLAFLPEPGEEG